MLFPEPAGPTIRLNPFFETFPSAGSSLKDKAICFLFSSKGALSSIS